jgi:hypothetical protein
MVPPYYQRNVHPQPDGLITHYVYNQFLMDPPLVLLDSPFFTKINTVHGPLQRHHTTNCADCGSCWTMRLKEFWSHAFHLLIPVNPCFAGRFHQGAIHKLYNLIQIWCWLMSQTSGAHSGSSVSLIRQQPNVQGLKFLSMQFHQSGI